MNSWTVSIGFKMLKGKSKCIAIILLVISLLLPGCTRQDEREIKTENVISLIELNFELENFIGENIWTSGFYADDRFTDDSVAFLVPDFYMMVIDEGLPDYSFARLDGNVPPYDMNEAEILVYGEVKDFAQTYNAFTLLPTPLITVEEYRILNPLVEAARARQGSFSPTAWGGSLQPKTAFAQESAATPTKARDCDRALIISGGIDANNNRSRFQQNMRAKYQKLKELGFSDEQIGVLYNDGGEVKVTEKDESNNEIERNIVDGKASKQKIKETLEKYKEEMSASCTLVIFVTDHGTGYNDGQGYRGARPAFSGTDSKTKTYPEKTFEIDLCRYVYVSGGWLKIESKEWDTDKDGEIDLKAECDTRTREYVLKRKMPDGTWKEIGRATGDTKKWGIKCKITGVDWNADGDKDDDVGFHEGINLWEKEVLWDDDFAEMLKSLHEKGIHIVVEMAQCFGGGFVDNLKGIVDKIVTFSGEDTKHHNRKDASGKRYAADEMAFVDNLAGIDLKSWDKAFDKAKEVDTQEWEEEGSFSDEENEYSKWEKPLIQTDSTFYEEDGTYTLTLKIPEGMKDKVYDIEILFGLQTPRWDEGEVVQLPEGFTKEDIAGGIRIKSTNPFPLTPLVFKLKGAGGADSLRIHLTDKEHRNLGYITPTKTTPPVSPAEEVLGASLTPSARSVWDESGCHSTLTISFDGIDLTGGDMPVTSVVLKVNGEVWHDSSSISTEHYQNSVSREVGCGEILRVELTATNAIGQTVTATESITTSIPPPPEPEEVLQVSCAASGRSVRDESGCRSTVTISFDCTDLTGGNYPVTKVVLVVNGQTWFDSGSISTVHYNNSIETEANCGETFNFEVTATNEIGLTATSTGSITTPVP